MGGIKQITKYLSYLPSSDNPLSADVYFIAGKEKTYIVDVGENEEAAKLINEIDNKAIIITHFHQDHMGNLLSGRITASDIYVGSYCAKSLGYGTVVSKEIVIEDGVKIKILPLPSSHAKGSLCVCINDDYLIMGDGFYCSIKGYNVSLLYDEIVMLSKLDFEHAVMSHDEKVYDREYVLKNLRAIYDMKESGEAFIMPKEMM